MTLHEARSVTVFRRGSVVTGGDPTRTVLWLRGEHDTATQAALSLTMVDAALLDDGDLLVDLSDVQFMDASTIGALVGVRNRLRAASRALTVRDPSQRARRLLELCKLEGLIEATAEVIHPIGPVAALSTWVALAPSTPPTPRQDSSDFDSDSDSAEAGHPHLADAVGSSNRADP